MPRCPRCLRTPSYKLHFVYIAFFCCQPTEQHSQPGVRAAFAVGTLCASNRTSCSRAHLSVLLPILLLHATSTKSSFFLLSIVRNHYAFPIHCSGASAFSAVTVTGPESSVGHETLLSSCLCLNLTPGAHLLLKGARQILGRIIAHRPRKEKTSKRSNCTSKCRNRLSHSKIVRTLVLLLLSSVLSSVFLIEFFQFFFLFLFIPPWSFVFLHFFPVLLQSSFSIFSFIFSSSSIALISVT